MNKLICFVTSVSFCLCSLADDTEIYGATAIDAENRINSNVLFIMDTSGSMDEEVTTAHTPYNKDFPYLGLYTSNHVYTSNDANTASGYPITNMKTGCGNEVSALKEVGKRYDHYQQKYSNWGPLGSDTTKDIRCDYTYPGYSNLLYTGNYLNWLESVGGVESTRIAVVVDVVKELTLSLSNINLGLMRFDRNSDGGMIDVPVSDIATSGPLIRAKLDDYQPDGGTPLEETMYEAARYYRGESWVFGNNSQPNPSVSDSRIAADSGTYKSPISASCQKNHIILLTDGAPTSDSSANNAIKELVADITLPSGLSKECSGNGNCMEELAYWMQNTDHALDKTGNQAITTYTIGGFDLASGVERLKLAAEWGGGRYFEANNTVGLTEALDSIFLDILATDSTFTAPAVSVNAFNASEHRDELFYALFRPNDNIKWTGNLKKYKLLPDGTVVGTDQTIPAISTSTGFFNESIFDYWNASDPKVPDGKNVQLGGMANLLTASPLNRNILSNADTSDDQILKSFTAKGDESVANKTSFGIESDDEFTKVHNWSMGQDVFDQNGDADITDSRQSIGDPLHTEPVIVAYGGSDESPISSIFFGTNEGFLHSLDTVTGKELFSFIPYKLHSIQKKYYDNNTAAGDKPYGMDGPISTWFYDKNDSNLLYDHDGNIETGEHVYLYAGMRRGGSNYYALDVSNRTTPTMKFMIEGGTGVFRNLGQTWSKMTPAKVKLGGVETFVVFFSGGYDTNQDSNTVPEDDTIGNAIYMVDASNGNLLWWASDGPDLSGNKPDLTISTMTNSIPASISAVDITGDGFVNYLFAADTGGRVFRVDIKQNNTDKSDFAKGGEIASLAGSNAETPGTADPTETAAIASENNRRFYNKPNVSLVKDKQYGDYLTISIGSGYRAHPILTTNVKNRFYMIKDFHPYEAPDTYSSKKEAPSTQKTLGESGAANPLLLYNATSLMTEGDIALTSDMKIIMNGGGGWYVEMINSGEKVLSESTTFSGAIIFTSFAPSSESNTTNCGADTGTSRTYAISQKFAMAVIDLDDDGDTDIDDVSKELAHSGIAPRPVIIYRKGGGKSIAIGTETIDDNRWDTNNVDACVALGTCAAPAPVQPIKCVSSNCYVTPVYWRQNNSTPPVLPEE